jgi:hypothetical protein
MPCKPNSSARTHDFPSEAGASLGYLGLMILKPRSYGASRSDRAGRW